jgi:RHS repeat-associated protein
VEYDHDPVATNETKRFVGERYDAGAGLLYLNARYYDPKLALFIQPDWFEVAKTGVGTNRYSYSFNDPVNKFDPGGNLVQFAVIAACAGGACETFAAGLVRAIAFGFILLPTR